MENKTIQQQINDIKDKYGKYPNDVNLHGYIAEIKYNGISNNIVIIAENIKKAIDKVLSQNDRTVSKIELISDNIEICYRKKLIIENIQLLFI